MKNNIKINNYDKFKCIADKCKFTCCSGWDVSIDDDTYFRLKEDKDLNYITKKIYRCCDRNEYYIDKDIQEACPFLDINGLCNIVKEHGDEYLSLTCQSFPRIENVFSDRKELSLSCACPEVVDMISENEGDLLLGITESNVTELKIRDLLIKILRENSISLEYRLIATFEMLFEIIDKDVITDEYLLNLEEVTLKYVEKEFNELEFNEIESLEEVNNLFLDITENYRKVSSLKDTLNDVCNYAEELDIHYISSKWNEFKDKFSLFNDLIERFIISKIFSNCANEDKVDIIISFQHIILEFILMRHAIFIQYLLSEDRIVEVQDIKDYVVIFSRVIGNNAEAVNEFIEDGFGDVILELGYLCFITLF